MLSIGRSTALPLYEALDGAATGRWRAQEIFRDANLDGLLLVERRELGCWFFINTRLVMRYCPWSEK